MNKYLCKKAVLFSLVFLFSIICHAQVNIEISNVNEYAFNTKEALNLIVTNGNTKSFNVLFNGKINDGNGNVVVEFKTNEAVLNIGANVFSPLLLSIAEIQYSNTDIAEIEMSSGTYPSGNYTICIWLSCISQDCNGLGSYASNMEPKCIPVHIENPTPLILATPENEAEIEETRPLYTWIPPAPVAGSSNLNYTMVLVEMLDGQSKADALTQNRPLIEMEGIGNPALLHPNDLPELERGKWYAWQVQAYVGKTLIAKSEQWKFKVKKKEDPKGNRFFDLNQNNISEIPKIGKSGKLYFIIQNGMLNQAPVFKINLLNGKAVYPRIERITKDSSNMEFDEFSGDLIHSGLTKYYIEITPRIFAKSGIYEMYLTFNNRKTIFRFEIVD